jgi:hypothetical protein
MILLINRAVPWLFFLYSRRHANVQLKWTVGESVDKPSTVVRHLDYAILKGYEKMTWEQSLLQIYNNGEMHACMLHTWEDRSFTLPIQFLKFAPLNAISEII